MFISPNPTDSPIGIILYGVAAVVAAIGIPKIYETWKEVKKYRYAALKEKEEHNEKLISELQQEIQILKRNQDRIDIILTEFVPFLEKYGASENEFTRDMIEVLKRLKKPESETTPAG